MKSRENTLCSKGHSSMQTEDDLELRELRVPGVWVQEIKSAEKDNLKHETEPGEISRAGFGGERGTRETTCKEIGGCREQKTMVKPEHHFFRNKTMPCGI